MSEKQFKKQKFTKNRPFPRKNDIKGIMSKKRFFRQKRKIFQEKKRRFFREKREDF